MAAIHVSVPAAEWQAFLQEQQDLLARRTEKAKQGLPALTAKIRLPSGEVVDQYDGSYRLREARLPASGGSPSNDALGSTLNASVLRWRTLPVDGTYTFELWLNYWKSPPVQVQVSQGVAVPDVILVEMQDDPEFQPPNPTVITPNN